MGIDLGRTARRRLFHPDACRLLARRVYVFPIRLYQRFISPILRADCRFYPSCSAYAVEAVMTHGIAKGTFLAAWRLLRCNPWSEGGYDPVPPLPKGESSPAAVPASLFSGSSGHHDDAAGRLFSNFRSH